ncbi:MAG: VOC family protein [Acidobacteria bacterium]|nr:VOC family protein [Acidobacteriota bacterium]
MKPLVSCFLVVLATCALSKSAERRPKITGIDHVEFLTTAPQETDHLFVTVLGLSAADPLESEQTQRYTVGTQWIGFRPAPDAKVNNRMDHVAFSTEDCQALRSYLSGKGIKADAIEQLKDGSHRFMVKDPDGHIIEFRQQEKPASPAAAKGDPVSRRMIHAGFIVRDRTAEDHFYLDILGFRPYWHGGMQPDRTDWVSLQVPDGSDWLEYMLSAPASPDLRVSGVLNHLSLGVRDMKQAQAKLESHGWPPHGVNEQPKIGKDGKWQLNLYDPDLTRVELMEFKPVEKPCCSEFQAPHPEEP